CGLGARERRRLVVALGLRALLDGVVVLVVVVIDGADDYEVLGVRVEPVGNEAGVAVLDDRGWCVEALSARVLAQVDRIAEVGGGGLLAGPRLPREEQARGRRRAPRVDPRESRPRLVPAPGSTAPATGASTRGHANVPLELGPGPALGAVAATETSRRRQD